MDGWRLGQQSPCWGHRGTLRAPGWLVLREMGSSASLVLQQEWGQSLDKAKQGRGDLSAAHFGNLMSKADRAAAGAAWGLTELLAKAPVGLPPAQSPSR